MGELRKLSGWKLPVAACLALLCCLGVQAQHETNGSSSQSYAPVAPPAALHAAIRHNLKIVNDWLANQDFASAAETGDGLNVLVAVFAGCSDEASWKETATALRKECAQLLVQARAKDAAGCEKSLQTCRELLAQLAEKLPGSAAPGARNARPQASNRTLMKLLDGSYADAKGAKSASDRTHLLFTIAEGANLTRYLRNEPAWQKQADDVRDEALRLANAKMDDLQSARRELKNIYERCQACHEAYKR